MRLLMSGLHTWYTKQHAQRGIGVLGYFVAQQAWKSIDLMISNHEKYASLLKHKVVCMIARHEAKEWVCIGIFSLHLVRQTLTGLPAADAGVTWFVQAPVEYL